MKQGVPGQAFVRALMKPGLVADYGPPEGVIPQGTAP